ncbi:hypothetical protein Vadar_013802 [Vaccinium darrowii]|uniref:Uncharacterized protein n=1 Tax=Vaccinium darrowii TaxID=229202 RepID=A0ACB7ZKF1_9ERIC|nr:hypothetical protein Vadar_013802 [Vaccinium darrowii]
MGKKGSTSFRSTGGRRRLKRPAEAAGMSPNSGLEAAAAVDKSIAAMGSTSKSVKKKGGGGARLWMRFDRFGQSEVIECEKSTIIKRASLPARDLRILGPVFSQTSHILAREKAMVVNLEFIKAIVTAEEVLLLEPLRQEVLPFVDQLRQQLPDRSRVKSQGGAQTAIQDDEPHSTTGGKWLPVPEATEDLERDAYPVLDELARKVSTKNLERVRSLKSNLTRLLARVQKVRDEIEHLLDDNEDMAQLYLTRKWIQSQQSEALLAAAASSSIVSAGPQPRHGSSRRSGSILSSIHRHEQDVEDLEMLLEAYFMQLDGTLNKILSVREYIDDTEDYVNIQLDNLRNELIQFHLTLTIGSFAITIETLFAAAFGMNIPCPWYNINGIFWLFVGVVTAFSVLIFLIVMGYARWKKLIGT